MWYDWFSRFYDRALERHYRPFRAAAVDALRLPRGGTALDLPCGTGQSLDLLVNAIGPTGRVVGVDYSKGMLRRAARRVEQGGWENVTLRRASVNDLDAALVTEAVGQPEVDGVLCAIGLTALPNWEAAFERLFARVKPGGRFVLFDVYAGGRTRHARMVELVARADLSRRGWEPLAARCADFTREVLPADRKRFGGELYVAAGTRA